MAQRHHQQHRNDPPTKKTGRRILNFVSFFTCKGSLLFAKASSSDIPTQKPDSSIDSFRQTRTCMAQKAWASICGVLPKQSVFSHEEVVETKGSPKLSSVEAKCCHQNSLEVSTSLERHILFCIMRKCSSKNYVLVHVENSCKCDLDSYAYGSVSSDNACAPSFVGIFLEARPKHAINLAHKLVDGGRAPRRLQSLAFARLQGEPGMICASSSQPHADFHQVVAAQRHTASMPSPLPSLLTLSLRSVKDQILHIVQPNLHQQEVPDKEMLDSVQDFFLYTESEGRKVFEELDRDADGRLTLADLKMAMKRMKLPTAYAGDFMRSKHSLLPSKHFGWSEFSSLMQEKEPMIVQLFNSLGVSKSGTVKGSHVKDSLVKAGLAATEVNVTAMIKLLVEDIDDGLKYGQFRRFMLLLPTKELSQDPWSVWLKAATTQEMERLSEDSQFSMLGNISSVSRNLPHCLEFPRGHSHR